MIAILFFHFNLPVFSVESLGGGGLHLELVYNKFKINNFPKSTKTGCYKYLNTRVGLCNERYKKKIL